MEDYGYSLHGDDVEFFSGNKFRMNLLSDEETAFGNIRVEWECTEVMVRFLTTVRATKMWPD